MTIPKMATSTSETALLMENDELMGENQSQSSQNSHHQTSVSPKRKKIQSPNQDFAFIKIIARITLQIIRKFWAFSSAAALAIILFYWLCGGFVAFSLVAFALSGLLYHSTDRFLYHPDQPATARVYVPSPSVLGLTFENVYIKTKDSVRLHMFFVKQVTEALTASSPTVLYFHGNAGNIGHRLMNVKGFVQMLGCNVCLLEYRGYGHSDGTPSEDGLYMDAQAALDYLVGRPDVDQRKIIVFGRSLGGAVAVDLASRLENSTKIRCLMVENTFTSIPEVAKSLFNLKFVRCLPRWFYKNQFLSRLKVPRLTVPVMFLSGTADQLIPPNMATELYNATSSETKQLARFPGGSHNETWMCSHYYQTIEYFLDEVVQIKDSSTRSRLQPPPTLVNSNNVV